MWFAPHPRLHHPSATGLATGGSRPSTTSLGARPSATRRSICTCLAARDLWQKASEPQPLNRCL